MQHVRAGTISLWQSQANELADEQAKTSSALYPSVAQVEQSNSARTLFLGWLAKFLGRLLCIRETMWLERRGAHGAAAAAQLVVFQREPRKKIPTHAKFSRTHTLAKTGHFGFCWRCGFYAAQRVKGLVGRCRGVVQSWDGVLKKLKDGRNPKDGRWLAEPTWHSVGRVTWSRWLRRKLGGTGVTWLSWSVTGSARISLQRDTNPRVTVVRERAQVCWTFSVADAVSLIRSSSQQKSRCFFLRQNSHELYF